MNNLERNTGFQFHYGTIKRKFISSFIPFVIYFNSTMVRLKDRPDTNEDLTVKFQFHYGTIKSWTKCATARTWSISIPLWYD